MKKENNNREQEKNLGTAKQDSAVISPDKNTYDEMIIKEKKPHQIICCKGCYELGKAQQKKDDEKIEEENKKLVLYNQTQADRIKELEERLDEQKKEELEFLEEIIDIINPIIKQFWGTSIPNKSKLELLLKKTELRIKQLEKKA